MPVIGVGVDVCDVARMARLLQRTPSAAARLFTPGELACAAPRPAAPARLAARFAAKEAVVKAVGGSAPGMRWQDVEVVMEGSAPRLSVTGAVALRAAALGVQRWHLSLTHDAGVAVAMVVAES